MAHIVNRVMSAGVLAVLLALSSCKTPDRAVRDDLSRRPLYTFSEDDVAAYIPIARNRHADLTDRIIHLARKNIGQPYDIYLLGEFPYETHDPDPLYCLARSDCLTFCEHMYSMALANDWWSFLQTLQRIRYKDGRIGMLTRNHYTIADWNPNNAFLLEDITEQLGDGRAVIPLEQVVRRATFFARFDIGHDVPDQAVRSAYIPTANVPDIAGQLHNGDFINIIRGNERSQYCGHTGLIAIGSDGAANFLHSARPAVREELLVGYLTRNKSLGIKVLRLRPDAERRMTDALADTSSATPVDSSTLALKLANWPLFSDKPSYANGWKAAMRLQAYRLETDTPADGDLQAALAAVDQRVRAELGIGVEHRGFGVLDLSDLRLALLAPDEIFYGASVTKIGIVLAYLAQDPQRAVDLDPAVMRELQLVIKRSDNALATKYSQIVGLDTIRELLQSKQYRLYDAEGGGGLWCGKHYGLPAPCEVDPVGGHSHAVTVRQCLRYYLMMEQGRLVNPCVSAVLKQIFAARELGFHIHNFVAGLEGRDVKILRKSGTWEDWHLDTARVQNGQRVYLLAGATHHPRGQEYLARMASEVDTLLCGEPPGS